MASRNPPWAAAADAVGRQGGKQLVSQGAAAAVRGPMEQWFQLSTSRGTQRKEEVRESVSGRVAGVGVGVGVEVDVDVDVVSNKKRSLASRMQLGRHH